MDLASFRREQAEERRQQTLKEESEIKNALVSSTHSNFLKFQGEDLDVVSRTRGQQLQMQDWLAAQIAMEKERDEQARKEQEEYERTQQNINDKLKEMELERSAQVRVLPVACVCVCVCVFLFLSSRCHCSWSFLSDGHSSC